MTHKFTFNVSSGTVFSNGWYAEDTDDDSAKKLVAATAKICQKGCAAELEYWQRIVQTLYDNGINEESPTLARAKARVVNAIQHVADNDDMLSGQITILW